MALIRCADCRREVSDRAKACPNCGSPIELSSRNGEDDLLGGMNNTPVSVKKITPVKIAVSLGIALVIVVGAFILFNNNKNDIVGIWEISGGGWEYQFWSDNKFTFDAFSRITYTGISYSGKYKVRGNTLTLYIAMETVANRGMDPPSDIERYKIKLLDGYLFMMGEGWRSEHKYIKK